VAEEPPRRRTASTNAAGKYWVHPPGSSVVQRTCFGICDATFWASRRRIDDLMALRYGYEGCVVPGRLPPTTTAGEYARRGVIFEKGAGGVS
jgi:hypothetical protein